MVMKYLKSDLDILFLFVCAAVGESSKNESQLDIIEHEKM